MAQTRPEWIRRRSRSTDEPEAVASAEENRQFLSQPPHNPNLSVRGDLNIEDLEFLVTKLRRYMDNAAGMAEWLSASGYNDKLAEWMKGEAHGQVLSYAKVIAFLTGDLKWRVFNQAHATARKRIESDRTRTRNAEPD